MDESTKKRFDRMNDTLNLKHPDRMPMGDWGFIEYRPDVYHLGSPEYAIKPNEVGISKDGKKRFTRDGGVWAVGDEEKYRDYEDVLNVNLGDFEVEEVDSKMLDQMTQIYESRSKSCLPVPWHYGTLVTRATIEFGWEPFLTALIVDPERFGEILDRFGQASLAVVKGWSQIEGVKLIGIHDDIAGTRGVFIKPEWYQKYVFPWYKRIFDVIHESGKKALYVSDGNYMSVLDDILATGTDGLYIESTSMSPREFMTKAGKDKLYLLKTDSLNIDFGTPDDIYRELKELSEFHQEYHGIMIYMGGGNPRPGNVKAFNRYFNELLVY